MAEKPCFPIVMRLLRIVSVLVRQYYALLVTQCEIFLSLLIKFLDPEKPAWQRALTLEVLVKLCPQPALIRSGWRRMAVSDADLPFGGVVKKFRDRV